MNIALLSIGTLQNPKESARITLLLLAQSMVQKGHFVTIFARKNKNFPRQEKIGEVTLLRIANLYSYSRALRSYQQESGAYFDVIHSFSATPLFALIAKAAKISPKTRMIHTLKSYSKKRWTKHFYFLLNIVDVVTVPTKVFSHRLKGVNQKKIEVIYSPIDSTKFYPKKKQALKKKYGLDNHKILFYYGALWENKGINDLLRAVPLIIKDHSNLKLLIAPRYQNIKQQQKIVEELNLTPITEFVLNDIKIEDYVNLAEVVILPYRNLVGTEGNPSCLLEAMACKTPVVTSNLPELKEIAENCVLFAEPKNVESIANTMHKALTSYPPEFIENAYQKVQQFEVEVIISQLLKLYSQPQ